MSLIRPHLNFELAKGLYHHIKNNASNTYFTFSNNKDDTSSTSTSILLKNLIMLNRISELDVYMCYDRINWAKNTVFLAYDNNNQTQNVHVLTEDMRVYKCLDNLNGAQSIYKPTHTTFGPKNYEDGYTWKYLYTLTNREIHNYLTDEYIPINIEPAKNSIQNQTESYATGGTINSIKVITGGTNYTNVNVVIKGDGEGAVARAIVQSGIIKAIKVDNPGKGYTYATVEINGTGLNGKAEAQVSPYFGHGANLLKELNASTVMVISQQIPSTGDIELMPSTFTYNQIGLISGITDNKTGKISIPMVYKLKVSNGTLPANVTATLNNSIKCNIVSSETDNGNYYVYINGLPNNINIENIINKSITYNDKSANVLEIINSPLTISKDFNIVHLENIEVKTITNKNLDILRLVIKGLPEEIEK